MEAQNQLRIVIVEGTLTQAALSQVLDTVADLVKQEPAVIAFNTGAMTQAQSDKLKEALANNKGQVMTLASTPPSGLNLNADAFVKGAKAAAKQLRRMSDHATPETTPTCTLFVCSKCGHQPDKRQDRRCPCPKCGKRAWKLKSPAAPAAASAIGEARPRHSNGTSQPINPNVIR